MKQLTFTSILFKLALIGSLLYFWLATASCTKEVPIISPDQKQTKVFATWMYGEDYAPANYPFFCFKTDWKRQPDTILYYATNTPDTNHAKLLVVQYDTTSTRRVDSSAVIANTLFIFSGEILHRHYNCLEYINRIEFANGEVYIRNKN